jgi:hypothetical protein
MLSFPQAWATQVRPSSAAPARKIFGVFIVIGLHQGLGKLDESWRGALPPR